MKKYLTKGVATAFLVAAASTNLAIADVDMAFGFGISGNYQFANKKIDSIAGFGLQDTKSGNFVIGGNAEFSIGLSEMFALSAGIFVDYSKYDQEFSSEAIAKMQKQLGEVVTVVNPDGTKTTYDTTKTTVFHGLRKGDLMNPFANVDQDKLRAIIRKSLFPTDRAGRLQFNRTLFNRINTDLNGELRRNVLMSGNNFMSIREIIGDTMDRGFAPASADQANTFSDLLLRTNVHDLSSLLFKIRVTASDILPGGAALTDDEKTLLQTIFNQISSGKNKYALYSLYGIIPSSAALLENASEVIKEEHQTQYLSSLQELKSMVDSQSVANKEELKRLIDNAKTQTGDVLAKTLEALKTQIEAETNATHKNNMLNYFNSAKAASGIATGVEQKHVGGSTISDAKLQLKDVRIGFAPAINFMISATDDVSFVIKFGPNIVYHMLKCTASAKVGDGSQSAESKAKYFSLDPQIGVGVQYKLPGDVAVLKLSVNYQTNNLIKFCGDKLKTTKTGTEEKDVKNLSSILGKDPELEFGSVSHMLGVTLGVNFLL